MFRKDQEFLSFKKPALILVGVLVLGLGIYVGVKSIKEEEPTQAMAVNKNETIEQSSRLSQDCEIWIQNNTSNGMESENRAMMVGTVPKELLNKSDKEITEYLNQQYPSKQVQSINKYEIMLVDKDTSQSMDITKANKYTIEEKDGIICVYKYDGQGNKEIIEKTDVDINSVPSTVQQEIKNGITRDTQDEIYGILENYGS